MLYLKVTLIASWNTVNKSWGNHLLLAFVSFKTIFLFILPSVLFVNKL